MAKRPIPMPELLRQLLDYDPSTGIFVWRARLPHHFTDGGHSPEHSCAAWNAKWAGKRADRSGHMHGYRIITILNHPHLAHRIAWTHAYNKWPDHHIDHINGIRDDNRIDNLRDVTATTNCRNISGVSKGATGYVGVRIKYGTRYYAEMGHKTIGIFRNIDDAIAARLNAEAEAGYIRRD